ncbi:phosphoglycolate phosphatase-like HAD superfamily hydrolase [Arcicella rosea]|uniref:HAD family hydrolase n=1 Tax=Arcicella rosea TaxID=502909 RepID=UPI00345D9EDA
MKNITDYKIILWDFDGVIMDSMPIRGKGFEEVLKEFPREQVEELLAFHEHNGGLSRYVKFKYFFEKIRGEVITDSQILEMAENFSKIMLDLLIDEKLLIQDSVNFIQKNVKNYEMHIVSGSDGKELNLICQSLDLARYFKTINGSPSPKNELVRRIIQENIYDLEDYVLIGDSINDVEAAEVNRISFIGYNNMNIRSKDRLYVDSFSSIG